MSTPKQQSEKNAKSERRKMHTGPKETFLRKDEYPEKKLTALLETREKEKKDI